MEQTKCQVHMLPTDQDNPVSVPFTKMPQNSKLVKHAAGGEFRRYLSMGYKSQHLYFTDDSEIKEGDYFLYGTTPKFLRKCSHTDSIDVWENGNSFRKTDCGKVIASTNPELWSYDYSDKKPGQPPSINTIPKIDIQFIEDYIKSYNEGNPIREVLLEKEINQCDGCKAGLPIENGIHKDHQVFGIACSAERYDKPNLKSDGSVIVISA